ncbi:MAG: hypothetical protein ACP5F9_11115, partial [Thiomonas sp.]
GLGQDQLYAAHNTLRALQYSAKPQRRLNMARHIDEHIAALETKLKQARALKQKLEAQKRAIERKKKRREDTRRKVLVGACVLRSIESGEWPQEKLQELLDKSLSRNDDRALFDLPPLPPKPKQPSEPNETPEPPQA